MNHYKRMTLKDKQQLEHLFKCGLSPTETVRKFPFGIDTIKNYFRGFRNQGIEKYEEINNDAKCNS